MEFLASSYLDKPDDPSMLTEKQIEDSWGSFSDFMFSYGLKPYNPEDCEEAVAISKAFAENNREAAEAEAVEVFTKYLDQVWCQFEIAPKQSELNLPD